MSNTWLSHHGIKGQKWGVRRFQNKDGSLTAAGRMRYKGKSLYRYETIDPQLYAKNSAFWRKDGPLSKEPDDYLIKKGENFFRTSNEENETFKDKMYVSKEKDVYDEGLIGEDKSHYYITEYRLTRDVVIAGKSTVETILKEMGKNPITKEDYDKYDHYKNYDNLPDNPNDVIFGNKSADFYYKDPEMAKNFTKILKDRGYDGLMDPIDSNIGNHSHITAMIFVEDVLEKIGQQKLRKDWR